jgi:hypothetical protein
MTLTLRQLLRSDSPESTTRLCFLLIVLSVIGWEWWAIIHKSTVPHITELLTFAGVTLGWKQYQETKIKSDTP